MTTVPFGSAGMAGSQTEDFTAVEVITGDMPIHHTSHPVASALLTSGLPIFSVVGLNTDGDIVMAQTSSTAVKPIGITAAEVLPDSDPTSVPVWRTGIFNPAALNWHEDYDTLAKQIAAFEDAALAANTRIILRPIHG